MILRGQPVRVSSTGTELFRSGFYGVSSNVHLGPSAIECHSERSRRIYVRQAPRPDPSDPDPSTSLRMTWGWLGMTWGQFRMTWGRLGMTRGQFRMTREQFRMTRGRLGMTWGRLNDMGTVPGSRGSHSIAWNIRGDGGVYLGLLGVIAFRLFNPARSSGLSDTPQ